MIAATFSDGAGENCVLGSGLYFGHSTRRGSTGSPFPNEATYPVLRKGLGKISRCGSGFQVSGPCKSPRQDIESRLTMALIYFSDLDISTASDPLNSRNSISSKSLVIASTDNIGVRL
jgi:hypothetical protein